MTAVWAETMTGVASKAAKGKIIWQWAAWHNILYTIYFTRDNNLFFFFFFKKKKNSPGNTDHMQV